MQRSKNIFDTDWHMINVLTSKRQVSSLKLLKCLTINDLIKLPSFLVQSFKETLQYCDEWRKFTSVSDSVSQSVSQSVIV